MKNIINSFFICLSTFSIIPTKNVEWNNKSMKYVFCFFPFIGLVVGLMEYSWLMLSHSQNINSVLYACVATVIPVIITGGIHIDGLIDTFDAIFCYGDVDKRLEVLKDSRVGAFGVIYTIMYFILTFGVFESVFYKDVSLVLFVSVYCISRITSGIITVNFPQSKDSGLQKNFTEDSNVKIVNFVLVALLILFMIINSIKFDVLVLMSIIVFYSWLYRFSKKLIGGLAGDLIGFSLTIFELILLVVVLVV